MFFHFLEYDVERRDIVIEYIDGYLCNIIPFHKDAHRLNRLKRTGNAKRVPVFIFQGDTVNVFFHSTAFADSLRNFIRDSGVICREIDIVRD